MYRSIPIFPNSRSFFKTKKGRSLSKPALSKLFASDVLQEVNDAVGITPFVVVPGNDLEEALLAGKVVLESCLAVID